MPKMNWMKQYYFLIFLFPVYLNAQVNEGLGTEERAYLFHIVKKSPILDNAIGRYFDYKGPDVRLPNKEINYDSIELIIINQPDFLIIRKEEIAKSPKGIIGEAANKMALWELNKLLLAKRGSEKELEPYQEKSAIFDAYLIEKLPPNALKEKDGIMQPHPKMINVMNPGLSLDDKIALIETMRFLEPNDRIVALNAMNYATNAYVEKRTLEIYRALGGEATDFQNILVAAGDGSSTAGLLEEREKDEKGRWNKGLPKAIGLFPYQLKMKTISGKKEPAIDPDMFTTNDLKTVGNNRMTNLHFDVWGYNSKKQTTVVIEKNGLSYHLFGSGETRFLSPDSTFSDGETFQSVINDLEKNKIAKLNDMIYGKRGFDYWIDYNKKKKDETELKIEINEKEYSDLSLNPISTKDKAPKSVKKSKKRLKKDTNYGPPANQPRTPPTYIEGDKKKKRKSQQEIVDLYNRYEAYKKKIAELEKQKQEAIDLMAKYQHRLDIYKQMMGYKWAIYTEKDGLYTFQDSTTFDLYTQEFQFPASAKSEDFEVRLLAIPVSSISDEADEVMLHINLIDAAPNYNARLQVELQDVFASDSYALDRRLFGKEDSVAMLQFFEGMLDKKVELSLVARGQGIGYWNGARTVKAINPTEVSSYPVSRDDSTMVRLRRSELFIHLNRGIQIEVNSYTDPVKSNLQISDASLTELMTKYRLSKNDILSAMRTATILNKLKEEINVTAGTYLSREKAKLVIDRFNKEWAKTRISVGQTSIKLTDLGL
jgi:hypothetical protein